MHKIGDLLKHKVIICTSIDNKYENCMWALKRVKQPLPLEHRLFPTHESIKLAGNLMLLAERKSMV